MRITGKWVIAYVADYFDLEVSDLTGPVRTLPVARARQTAMYVMRQVCPHLSYPEIGRFLGGRDHTTVIHGVRKIEQLVADRQPISDHVHEIVEYFMDIDAQHGSAVLKRQIARAEQQLAMLRRQQAEMMGQAA